MVGDPINVLFHLWLMQKSLGVKKERGEENIRGETNLGKGTHLRLEKITTTLLMKNRLIPTQGT